MFVLFFFPLFERCDTIFFSLKKQTNKQTNKQNKKRGFILSCIYCVSLPRPLRTVAALRFLPTTYSFVYTCFLASSILSEAHSSPASAAIRRTQATTFGLFGSTPCGRWGSFFATWGKTRRRPIGKNKKPGGRVKRAGQPASVGDVDAIQVNHSPNDLPHSSCFAPAFHTVLPF